MIDNIVHKAVANLVVARRAFFEAVGIPASTPLSGPASDEDILNLEKCLQRRLPPSYHSFLLLHNGLPELDGDTNVLNVGEMISLVEEGSAKLLDRIAKLSREESIRHCIVFGLSKKLTSAFLFDPEKQNNSGEWAVIEYDEEEGIDSVHESFLSFLIASTAEAREAEQETHEGQDILDEDF
ncbi:MAG: SMI1/KNR4 family protein [Cyclobacteriaceae bacterium]|nr:SMI1/KNR4 family protein [Cyclobacteriaceae bacterium]